MTTPSSLTPVAGPLVTVPNPAVGLDFTTVVPAEAIWEVLTVAFTATFAAGGPTRSVAIVFDNGGAPIFAGSAYDAGLAGGATVRFYFSQGFSKPWNDQGGVGYGGLPLGLRLYAGYRLRSNIIGLQAGDQLSSILLTVR